MKPGDLVRISGACYDAPINQHVAGEAILHYDCLLPNGTLGVIVDIVSGGAGTGGWCQVLTSGRTVWVNGSGVRAA
jgi:hypothetical protein